MTFSDPETVPRDQAYCSFTEKLLSRQLRPGQFLTQRGLADITGLPLGAIREIVPRLEAEGLMKTMPGRGMQIAPIDLNLIREAFQFRLFIEREAVALFTYTATDGQLAELRRSHTEMLALSRTGPLIPEQNDWAQRLDWGMHDAIVESVGNAILTRAYVVNSVKIRLIHYERFRINGRIESAMTEHLAIIAALEARDPDRAAQAISTHIDNARSVALDL